MPRYVGVIDGSGDVWGVIVPDLPGVHGGGPTAEAAIDDAILAMRKWAMSMLAKGHQIPPPRDLDTVLAEVAAELPNQTATGVLLPLFLEGGKPVRVNISIDAHLVADIDAAATARGMTRSAFLFEAARRMIERDGA